MINDLIDALNDELATVLGAKHNWMGVITGVAGRRADKLLRNGLFEDVVTDVSSDIILDARDGTLSKAVIKAKESSKTEDELVENLRHVVMKAAYYRASDAMRWKYRGATQFSQIGIDGNQDFSSTIIDRKTSDQDSPDYAQLVSDELELMAVASEWKNKNKLAKRFRFAKEMVADRIDGMSMGELMDKYDVRKTKMSVILIDIERAVVSMANRIGSKSLLKGIEGAKVG